MPGLAFLSQKMAEPGPKLYGAKIVNFCRTKLCRAVTGRVEVSEKFYLTTT